MLAPGFGGPGQTVPPSGYHQALMPPFPTETPSPFDWTSLFASFPTPHTQPPTTHSCPFPDSTGWSMQPAKLLLWLPRLPPLCTTCMHFLISSGKHGWWKACEQKGRKQQKGLLVGQRCRCRASDNRLCQKSWVPATASLPCTLMLALTFSSFSLALTEQ